MDTITDWISAWGAVAAVFVAAGSPLIARVTLSSGLKQADDLLELARRYHQLESSKLAGWEREEGDVSRTKDAVARYKKKLSDLHVIAVLGAEKLVAITFTYLAVALSFFALAWFVDGFWGLLLIVLGSGSAVAIPGWFAVRTRKSLI